MIMAPILLTLTIAAIAFASWFGVLADLNCVQAAHRRYFIGLTKQRHLQKKTQVQFSCRGDWNFSFDQVSVSKRLNTQHELKDWGLPHEQSKRK